MGSIKTVEIRAYTRDCCSVIVKNYNGEEVYNKSDYVPEWLPGGGGDSLRLMVDNKTGKILNWEEVRPEHIEDEDY